MYTKAAPLPALRKPSRRKSRSVSKPVAIRPTGLSPHRRLARRSQRRRRHPCRPGRVFTVARSSATATSPRLWAPRARLFYQRDMASICPQAPDCLQCSTSIAAERAPGATNLIAMEQWMPSSTLTCETPSPRGTPSGQNAWTPSVSICDHGQAEALSERGDDGKKNIKHMVVKVHALTDRMGQMRRQTQRCSAYSKGATPRLRPLEEGCCRRVRLTGAVWYSSAAVHQGRRCSILIGALTESSHAFIAAWN